MRNILSVGLLTFKEGIREKVFYGIGVLFLFILFLSYLLSQMAYGEQAKVLRDVGLAGIELTGLIVVIFFMVNSFYRERETKMLEVYLVKFSRFEFILGKFLGSGLIIFVFIMLGIGSFSVLLFAQKAFYFSLILGVYFIFLKLLIILAFGLLFSTFISSPVLAYLLSLVMYITGSSMRNALEIINQEGSQFSRVLFKYLYYLLPNLDKLEIKLLVAYGNVPPIPQVFFGTLYTLVYVGFLLTLTLLIFKNKEC
jgi:ABC-type transport system involved in multi-copper enzyme maturation permease subunit